MKNVILMVVVVIAVAVAAWQVMLEPTGQSAEPSKAEYAEEKMLNVYNWSDYIAADTIDDFEKEYGIEVNYDVFDSNELLESKLLAGNTGFDIVVPSASFMGRQIVAGVFLELDMNQLPNYKNLDPKIMSRLTNYDPDNKHGIPYLWGTTGIGYNPDKVRDVLGDDAPIDSWDLVMDPDNLQKLKQCGVSFLNAQSEMIPAVLKYLGEDPNSLDKALILDKARAHLLSLRPHITYLHSSQYINDLANGDICVAVGWSGDVLQAADKAAEGVTVEYLIPKEGAGMWFDMLAIPRDAAHPESAHLFIDYLLRPEVIAKISNEMYYANPNPPSASMIKPEITANQNIYPADGVDRLYTFILLPSEIDRLYTDVWRSFQSNEAQ